MTTAADQIIQMLVSRGGEAYLGEPLSQLDHARQTAHLARESGADDSLVTAALMHDIGHLLRPESSLAAHQFDRRHEEIGAAWLACWFRPEVTEPIRLHVTAKRYLCGIDQKYLRDLSAASIRSLELQGGPLGTAEAAEFEKNPYYESAVQLRLWDDKAKLPNFEVGNIQRYRDVVLRCVKAR
jgi:phosphonate degradation associated HDIG domain protein